MPTFEADPYPWPYNGDWRPDNTAIIVIDMQTDFCGQGGYVNQPGVSLAVFPGTEAGQTQLDDLPLVFREVDFIQFVAGVQVGQTLHDGLDLCHAVLGAAYGSLITLDRHWKRRVLALPNAAKLARTYYRAEIDDLVALLETLR